MKMLAFRNWKVVYVTFNFYVQIFTSLAVSIVSQPRNTAVISGASFQLDCVFNRRVLYCYWNKDGLIIEISDRYEFVKGRNATTWLGDCSLHITRAEYRYDDGIWNCGILQTFYHEDMRSRKAQVNVLVRPKEPVIFLNGMQQDNESIVPVNLLNVSKITCLSENGNLPANLSWQLDTTPIAGLTTIYNTTDEKIKRVELKITQQMDDSWKERKLICTSQHPSYGPNEQHFTYVTVKIPYPTTTVTALSANGTTDTTIKVDNQVWIGLNCTADGFPEPTYRWDRRTDDSSPWQLYKNEQNITFQAFSAQFQCVASNNFTSYVIRSRQIFTIITSYASFPMTRNFTPIILVVLFLIFFSMNGVFCLYKTMKWIFKASIHQQKPCVLLKKVQPKKIFLQPSVAITERKSQCNNISGPGDSNDYVNAVLDKDLSTDGDYLVPKSSSKTISTLTNMPEEERLQAAHDQADTEDYHIYSEIEIYENVPK